MKTLWEEYLIQKDLVGNSPAIYQIRRALATLAKGNQPVLINGEPGTEKLLLAKLIIDHSLRKDAPVFITDAAKLTKTFDHELQSIFNRQIATSPEKIFGTLIIQNLEYLDKEAQARTMSFLQGGYLEGAEPSSPLAVDLRILSTASDKLNESIKEGLFDAELQLALSAIMVKLPSIRERKQDILILFDYFLNYFCDKMDRIVPPMPFEIYHQILKYNWPGNVKEIENAVRSLVSNSPEGQLSVEALPFFDDSEAFHRVELSDLNHAVSKLEREMIERALRRFAGNQSRAAQVLQLSEPNLRFKMKRLGIYKDDFTMGSE